MPVTAIDPILDIKAICALLKIGRTKFYRLKRDGRFGKDLPALVPVRPSFSDGERYHGAPFAEWLERGTQDRLARDEVRALLKAVK